MFNAPHLFRSRRAESLAETMIAVTVIVITTTAALTLMRTAVTGNQVIGEKIVALNLALEGIEGVRNIRDTNYLKFPSDPDLCWNAFGALSVGECAIKKIEGEPTAPTQYHFLRNIDFTTGPLFSWDMEEIDPSDVDDGWVDLYAISGPLIGDLLYYAQSGETGVGSTQTTQQAYYRYVEFDYTNYEPLREAVDATVTVEWEVKGQMKSVSESQTITNNY